MRTTTFTVFFKMFLVFWNFGILLKTDKCFTDNEFGIYHFLCDPHHCNRLLDRRYCTPCPEIWLVYLFYQTLVRFPSNFYFLCKFFSKKFFLKYFTLQKLFDKKFTTRGLYERNLVQ
jgi:hypothetical protein